MATSIKLSDLTDFICCSICQGFLIDATTISECLHTFCKTCIVKHIKNDNNECPKCNTIIHQRRPLDYIMQDRNKQDIVYKLVPQLYASELDKSISEDQKTLEVTLYPTSAPKAAIPISKSTNTPNIEPNHSSLFTSPSSSSSSAARLTLQSQEKNPYICLKCPLTVKIRDLKKIIWHSHQLDSTDRIAMYYKGDIVSDDDYVCNLAQSLSFYFDFEISRFIVKKESKSFETESTR